MEFLRKTGSPTNLRVRRLVSTRGTLVLTDAVLMELLSGARTDQRARELRRFLLSFEHVPTDPVADFEAAAAVYRACQREGETVRSLVDCLVAAVALRAGLPVLARDRDFEVIARHTGLELDAG